jgi:hypothetical protein
LSAPYAKLSVFDEEIADENAGLPSGTTFEHTFLRVAMSGAWSLERKLKEIATGSDIFSNRKGAIKRFDPSV